MRQCQLLKVHIPQKQVDLRRIPHPRICFVIFFNFSRTFFETYIGYGRVSILTKVTFGGTILVADGFTVGW